MTAVQKTVQRVLAANKSAPEKAQLESVVATLNAEIVLSETEGADENYLAPWRNELAKTEARLETLSSAKTRSKAESQDSPLRAGQKAALLTA